MGVVFSIVVLVDDNDYYLVFTIYLEFGGSFSCNESYKEVCLKIKNDYEFLIRDTPPKFDEDIKFTTYELKEVNLGTKKDPHLMFISSLLNKEKSKNMIRLLFEFKDYIVGIYKEMFK